MTRSPEVVATGHVGQAAHHLDSGNGAWRFEGAEFHREGGIGDIDHAQQPRRPWSTLDKAETPGVYGRPRTPGRPPPPRPYPLIGVPWTPISTGNAGLETSITRRPDAVIGHVGEVAHHLHVVRTARRVETTDIYGEGGDGDVDHCAVRLAHRPRRRGRPPPRRRTHGPVWRGRRAPPGTRGRRRQWCAARRRFRRGRRRRPPPRRQAPCSACRGSTAGVGESITPPG